MKWQPAFGMVLKHRREVIARLTQKEVAEAVGRHAKTVAKWEQGRQMPHDRVLLKLIAAVRAEPEEFLQEVTRYLTQQLRDDYSEAAGASRTPAHQPVPRVSELHEAASERRLALPAHSPARSIRPELDELHRAIDKIVAGLATILTSQGHR